jgi:hypothetical protein
MTTTPTWVRRSSGKNEIASTSTSAVMIAVMRPAKAPNTIVGAKQIHRGFMARLMRAKTRSSNGRM